MGSAKKITGLPVTAAYGPNYGMNCWPLTESELSGFQVLLIDGSHRTSVVAGNRQGYEVRRVAITKLHAEPRASALCSCIALLVI